MDKMQQMARARCRTHMQMVIRDLVEGRSLRRDTLLPQEVDDDLFEALAVGDELEMLTGQPHEFGMDCPFENLVYVAKAAKCSRLQVLRGYRLWIGYRLGLLEGVTALRAAEMRCGIRDQRGVTHAEWALGDEKRGTLGAYGEAMAIIGLKSAEAA